MQGNIIYERKNNNMECVCYNDVKQSYPTHTHANHVVLGHIFEGEVCVDCDGEKQIYHAGDDFCILPDIPHALENVNGNAYSMIIVCVPSNKADEPENKFACVKKLKRLILDAPENTFPIAEMAQKIGMSRYHMIRSFKEACGLTPHQFQIQCKIRKAQRLLENEKSVTEAAYAAGFCDQSHFDRYFHRIVQMTPSEYMQSVKI